MAENLLARVEHLRRELERHNYLYYVDAKPQISDREYDRMMQELIDLETAHPELITPDSPSQRVGGAPLEGFATVHHAVPMMSIDNTYSAEDLRAFDERVRKGLGGEAAQYVLEEKVDGVAVSLRYENRVLVQAATRGDGRRGDEITRNVRTIGAVPLRLHDHAPGGVLEIRGEIYMSNEVFQELNRRLEREGIEPMKNPRNATAGTLKQLDPKVVASRRLQFLAHGLGQVDENQADNYWDWLQLLKKWRVPISPHAVLVQSMDEAVKVIEDFGRTRGALAYQTDGMVIKVNSFEQRRRLGATSKSPRWVMAYKYPAEQTQTLVLNVFWHVGKGGTLTPVADLEEVFISGTNVRRAVLHNIDQVRRLDIRVGDTVVVEKAGEIIPQVVQVVVEKRPRGAEEVAPPTVCPECHAPVEKEPDTPYIRCVNPACMAQLKERLRWFAARGQMNIENLGPALIDQLVDQKLVTTFADIYRLRYDQLLNLERMGEKSAANVMDSIQSSRQRPLDRLLAGLGIRHVGGRVAQVLAGQCKSLAALENAGKEELSAVNEIGPVIAESVYDFFHNPAGRKAVEELRSVGVDPKMEEAAASAAGGGLPLAGQSVVVTGTLKRFTREQIEELIQRLGGRSAGSVSKKTSFLVAGEEAGSKLQKAQDLKVEVLSEEQFLRRVGID